MAKRNVVRQAALFAEDLIDVHHLHLTPTQLLEHPRHDDAAPPASADWSNLSLREIVRRETVVLERHILVEALKLTHGNKLRAAKRLSIDYKTILVKIREYAIGEDDWQACRQPRTQTAAPAPSWNTTHREQTEMPIPGFIETF